MPEMRHYKVVQIREVDVSANSAVEASRIAEVAFDFGQNMGNGVIPSNLLNEVWGNTTSKVREISLRADEKGKVNG